jgi:hypothetical protein
MGWRVEEGRFMAAAQPTPATRATDMNVLRENPSPWVVLGRGDCPTQSKGQSVSIE